MASKQPSAHGRIPSQGYRHRPYLEASDRESIFKKHAFPEDTVDLGEVRMNYAVTGSDSSPAILLIPAQAESWWGYERCHAAAGRVVPGVRGRPPRPGQIDVDAWAADHVKRLVEDGGNSFAYKSFPKIPRSMHGHDPACYVATITAWLEERGPGKALSPLTGH